MHKNGDEIWMISNRQPWPEALVRRLITSKTRSAAVNLPPPGSTVFLHASKALWSGWRDLWWIEEYEIDVPNLPRGGVVAVARLRQVGRTGEVMPPSDRRFFKVGAEENVWSCAAPMAMIFEDIRPLPFTECRGVQVPTRKIPEALKQFL